MLDDPVTAPDGETYARHEAIRRGFAPEALFRDLYARHELEQWRAMPEADRARARASAPDDPVTLEAPRYPVTTSDGQILDLSALFRFWSARKVSPLTNAPLASSVAYVNLRAARTTNPDLVEDVRSGRTSAAVDLQALEREVREVVEGRAALSSLHPALAQDASFVASIVGARPALLAELSPEIPGFREIIQDSVQQSLRVYADLSEVVRRDPAVREALVRAHSGGITVLVDEGTATPELFEVAIRAHGSPYTDAPDTLKNDRALAEHALRVCPLDHVSLVFRALPSALQGDLALLSLAANRTGELAQATRQLLESWRPLEDARQAADHEAVPPLALRSLIAHDQAMAFVEEYCRRDPRVTAEVYRNYPALREVLSAKEKKHPDIVAVRALHDGVERALRQRSRRPSAQDREHWEALIRLDGRAMSSAPARIRDDPELGMLAVQSAPLALKSLSRRLKSDPDIVRAALERNPEAYRLASQGLRNRDRELARAALARNGELLSACKSFCDDEELVKVAVENKPDALRLASPRLRGMAEIVDAAMARDVIAYKHASRACRTEPERLAPFLNHHPELYAEVPYTMREQPEVALLALRAVAARGHPVDYDDVDRIIRWSGQLRRDPSFMRQAMSIVPDAIGAADFATQDALAMEAISLSPLGFMRLKYELREVPELRRKFVETWDVGYDASVMHDWLQDPTHGPKIVETLLQRSGELKALIQRREVKDLAARDPHIRSLLDAAMARLSAGGVSVP